MEKVILTTGGTGGHIFPALAVAEELRQRWPDIEILFMGSLYGPERKLAEKKELPFLGYNVRGLLGRGIRAFPAAINMAKAIIQACRDMAAFNPDIVAGFGGYASFAPMISAWLLRKPALLHEQNAIAGSGNRMLSLFANMVCVSLPGTKGFGNRIQLTGNPVRRDFITVYEKRQKMGARNKRLLILGGSQGAHALNDFICRNLAQLSREGISIRHQCGEKDLAKTREAYENCGLNSGQATAFIEDMAEALEWADAVLCRAGASTIAELCACGVPAIFVPFPAAIHDHQTRNAEAIASAGGAIILPETELAEQGLIKIRELLNNRIQLQVMGESTHKMARLEAASLLVDRMEELVKKRDGQGRHAKQNS